MEQISCLCSVRSWKYIHILHNNLHVTSYWYKLSYEIKKFVNAKVLALMALIYSECTYRVCESRCFWWHDSEKRALTGVWQLSVFVVYLVEQDLPLCSASRITAGGTASRTTTILQLKKIYLYISCFQNNLGRNGRVCFMTWVSFGSLKLVETK